MKMQSHGSSLRQSSTVAPGDVASSSKKKRNRPGNPEPDAEVVALSPQTLLATNRFMCHVCNKGFQQDQNLQLHLRGHNMPWKLKQRDSKEARRRVYLCPEPTCVHHNPSRALGDLTGIKKHYCRKHGEKNLKCDKCNKRYAVESDWKAHCKICNTREYRCECDSLFSSFITHRAMCDVALGAGRETMSHLGTALYTDSGSDSLGLCGAITHKHGFADQGSSAAEASQFDFNHIMASYSGPSMFCSHASSFSSSSFLGSGVHATNQDLYEDGGDHSKGSLGPFQQGKAPLYALMLHLPEQQYHPSSSDAYLGFFSSNNSGESSKHGHLLHGKEPFHDHDLIQLPEQHHHHQPGDINTNVNLPNVGFFSRNNGGNWSDSQDTRLVIKDQFNGGTSGNNTEHGNVMASIGSHFGGGFPFQYNSYPSASAGLSATALLMKATQMGSTMSTTHTSPNSLVHAAGFTSTVIDHGTSRAVEEGVYNEAYFHDLIMNSAPLMGGINGSFSSTTGLASVGSDNLSTRDFLSIGKDDSVAPQSLHMGALDLTQTKWYM